MQTNKEELRNQIIEALNTIDDVNKLEIIASMIKTIVFIEKNNS